MAFPEIVRVDGRWFIDCPVHGRTAPAQGFGGEKPRVVCRGRLGDGGWCKVAAPVPVEARGTRDEG